MTVAVVICASAAPGSSTSASAKHADRPQPPIASLAPCVLLLHLSHETHANPSHEPHACPRHSVDLMMIPVGMEGSNPEPDEPSSRRPAVTADWSRGNSHHCNRRIVAKKLHPPEAHKQLERASGHHLPRRFAPTLAPHPDARSDGLQLDYSCCAIAAPHARALEASVGCWHRRDSTSIGKALTPDAEQGSATFKFPYFPIQDPGLTDATRAPDDAVGGDSRGGPRSREGKGKGPGGRRAAPLARTT